MIFPFPYSNLYNLNLDWMIKTMKEMQAIVEPLDRVVNSVNNMTGDVTITKAFLLQILESMVSKFNGRAGDVTLTAADVNSTMIDITWTSDPGDVIEDIAQNVRDQLYAIGKRVLIFVNNQGVPDQIYFLTLVGDVVTPQIYSPTAALAGVASFNGQTGAVTATGSDLDTANDNDTPISESIEDLQNAVSQQSQQIGNLTNLETTVKTDLVSAVNENTEQIDDLGVGEDINASSLDLLKTNLISIARSMYAENSRSKLLRWMCNFTGTEFVNMATYTGYLKLISASSSYLYFVWNASSNVGDVVTMGYSNGTWSLSNLSIQDSIFTNRLKGRSRTMILIGDSYAESPTLAKSWATLVKDLIGDSDSIVIPKSGGGFNVNGQNQFLQALSSVNINYADKITDIVVAGGFNDANSAVLNTGIKNAIYDFCQYAKNNFPNAHIWIGFIGFGRFGTTYASNIDLTKYSTTKYYYKLYAGCNGAGYLDGCDVIMQNDENLSTADYIHPTEAGSEGLAYSIISVLCNGANAVAFSPRYMHFTPVTGTINDSSDGSSSAVYESNKSFVIDFGPFTIIPNPSITITQTSWTKIADFTGPYYASVPYIFDTPVQYIDDSLGRYTTMHGYIKFEKGSLYLKNGSLESSVYESKTTNTILIPEITVVIPML